MATEKKNTSSSLCSLISQKGHNVHNALQMSYYESVIFLEINEYLTKQIVIALK